jgi:ABC-2 type transport system ATP-binding protein
VDATTATGALPPRPRPDPATDASARSALQALPAPPAIETRALTRWFGHQRALDEVWLSVAPGRIHALLGPNGAGKTTLLRALVGLVAPSSGSVEVVGEDPSTASRSARAQTGFVPSGDRTFYLRLSGLENLLFFARLHGLRRRPARDHALALLDRVGLAEAARKPVGTYSHGMQKRLSVARALITEPPVLLMDEATHDLDPDASAGVRAIVERLASEGAAVLWATQRIDEIRGFAHEVTLLGAGRVRFSGSVPALMAHAQARRFVLRVTGAESVTALETALGPVAAVAPVDRDHWLIELAPGRVLGDAIAALARADVGVVACHRERSELEEAVVALGGKGSA